MKFFPFIVFLIPCVVFSWTETLTTSMYTIRIEWNCPEGYITCDNIAFKVQGHKEKEFKECKGATKHSIGADGVTPSRFLGYYFEDISGFKYNISDDGILEVKDSSGKIILLEEGPFDYEAQPVGVINSVTLRFTA